MTQPPRILRFGPASTVIKGDGWRVHVRITGWWRPRLSVHLYIDRPGYEIPQGSPYPVPEEEASR